MSANSHAAPGASISGRHWLVLPTWVRRHPWLTVACGVVVVSVALVAWARTRPAFDPYGWQVWGYQTWRGTLDLGGAPSWKPLPYVFTVPYALAGGHQVQLWMVTAVAISLAGPIFAGRIAYRAVDGASGGDTGSFPPAAAAVFAGFAVLGLEDYAHYMLSFQSDPVIVTLCLAAIDMHMCGRHRWAFAFAVLASLGRPEVWPFSGLYGIWAWIRLPRMRWLVAAGFGLILFMWFGIPWITNGRPNVSGQLAMASPRALRHNRLFGTIGRFTELEYLPVWVCAAVAVGVAVRRRDRLVLTLAAGVVAWVSVEIAFAFHGFPALSRYMFEAAAVAAVIAAIGVGWALAEISRRRLPGWSGVAIVCALAAVLAPGAVARLRAERRDLRHERGRARQIALLQTAINRLGGYRHIRFCGEPASYVEYSSALAWLTHLDVGSVGYEPAREIHRRIPIVLFFPVNSGGWVVRPWHTRHSRRADCAGLNAGYLLTARHPSGVLIRGA
jgi:hypothetical protein